MPSTESQIQAPVAQPREGRGVEPANHAASLQPMRSVGELVPVPLPSLRQAGIHLPVFITAELWDRHVVPPPTAEEQSRSRRMSVLLAVLRSVLAQIPPGRDTAAFSFQMKNRPLYRDTVHAWVAVQVEQPGGAPALVVGLDRCEEGGPA